MLTELRLRQLPCGARTPISGEAQILLSHAPCAITVCGRVVAYYAPSVLRRNVRWSSVD